MWKATLRLFRPFCSVTKIESHIAEGAASFEEVKGTKAGKDGIYALMLTCAPCGNKMTRTFTKRAYHHGVVLIRCDSCDNIHLIADNLGWFEDDTWNIEKNIQAPKLKMDDAQIKQLIDNFIK